MTSTSSPFEVFWENYRGPFDMRSFSRAAYHRGWNDRDPRKPREGLAQGVARAFAYRQKHQQEASKQ